MSLESNEMALDVWMYIYEHSPDSHLILKISIRGNADCTPVPGAAVGCTLGRGRGTSLKPSWDKGLVQHLPSAKGCRDTCPASLPAAPRWSQSHGAQPRAAIAPRSSATPRRNGKGGVQQNRREDSYRHCSLSSCLFPKCLHSPPSLSFESLLYFQLQPGRFWTCN